MNKAFELLIVAAESGEGQFKPMLDPKLAQTLRSNRINAHCLYMSQLQTEHLKKASALLLVRTPMPGHAKDDTREFLKLTPEIHDAVKNGLGLMIMFSESYGRSEGTLNEFAAPLGINFFFNLLTESDSARRGMLTNLDCGRTIVADCNGALIGAPELTSLEIVIEGGHGTEHLSCEIDENWKILVQGAASCRSEKFPEGLYSHGSPEAMNAPVLGAVREYGRGRIAAFPGAAPLWIASGFLPRFKGYLLERDNCNGLRFLLACLHHISRPAESGAAELFESIPDPTQGASAFSFAYATAEERNALQNMECVRIHIGSLPEKCVLETALDAASAAEIDVWVAVEKYDDLSPEIWRNRRRQYAQISTLTVVPGYEQLDDEGNASVVFAVDELPDQRKKYPGSNLLEDLLVKLSGYASIYARAESNRYPYYRHGGYNMMEVDTPGSLELYREKIATASCVSAVSVTRDELPGAGELKTYVLTPEKSQWKRYMTENFHYTFIATGSVKLRKFGFFGDRLMRDDWEGYWYEYDRGDRARLELEITADEDIAEIVVYDGLDVFFTSRDCGKHALIERELELSHDLRLHVACRTVSGERLVASYGVYTRCRAFWAHVGSDQMNDYHNVFAPDARGMMGIGDQFYEPYGFVTCGYAWGDYVRITTPMPWSELYPSGIEVSSQIANFKSFHPSLFARFCNGGGDFLNHHHRRLGYCDDRIHTVHSTAYGSFLETPGATWRGHGGKIFYPTRAITPSLNWQTEGTYNIPIWQPHGPTVIQFAIQVKFLRECTLERSSRIVVAQSLHANKPTLKINGIPFVDLLQPEPAVAIDGGKEWDNLAVFHQLSTERFFTDDRRLRLECGELTITGDDGGTFRFAWPETTEQPIFVRLWRWRQDDFMISYELDMGRAQFRDGETLDLKYQISLQ